jgi:hypothetical protein
LEHTASIKERRKLMRVPIIFLICLGAVLCVAPCAFAQPPAIEINLSFDRSSYDYGEPIMVEVEVSNWSDDQILINYGFSDTVFYQQMRIIDPAGRLLGVVIQEEYPDELPDAPAVPVIYQDGKFIRWSPYETLSSDWGTSQTGNLLDSYPMLLPGYYSAQVQVSVMTFKAEDPGNIHNYAWRGVLKSETQYFYIHGSSQGIQVIPNQWRLAWLEEGNTFPPVQVQIDPPKGQTSGDYDVSMIRLNGVLAESVTVLPSMLKAFFDPKEVMENLGEVEVREWYPVIISGKMKSGEFFGGEQQVRVVN